MATSLRAFLLTRVLSGDWTVTVHRDLEDLLGTWNSKEFRDEAVGVLHVGYDRPPAREFDEVADLHIGHMLVTAAAKYALPPAFLTSRYAIHTVADLPIYLGLRGWGYLIEDDSVAAAPTDLDSERAFEEWILRFTESAPEHASTLAAANIYCDADYLSREISLTADLRRQLGLYRVRALSQDVDDPCALAAAAPPWLAVRAVESMNLTVRVANVFVNYGIVAVSDLAKWSTPRLLGLPNFGRTSVRDLCESLEAALREGPADTETRKKNEEAERLSLLSGIRRALLVFPERERDILQRRIGLLGASETLQQIADNYNITRERVRQIESKTLQKLVRGAIWGDVLENKLQALLHDRSYPLPVKGIEAADSWFEGIGEFSDVLHYILTNFCGDGIGIVSVDGVEYFARMDQARWDAALSEARRLLESGVGKAWTEENCRALVGNLLSETSREFRELLWDKVVGLCHFSTDLSGSFLASFGRGVEQIVEAVLSESDEPLHFSTISALAADRSGRPVDIRRAHNAAAAVGYLLGRGTYGVERHLPKPEVLQKVSEEAEEVISLGAPGRQWHASEILSSIVERQADGSLPPELDKYIVDIALQKSGNLKRLGRQVWSGGDADLEARIDVRQAIVSLLQQAGRPLKTDEIRQRLIALRGVNEHFQIASHDPLLRIGVGLWGLNDRDISIKREHQPRLWEGLVGILRTRGSGVHVSELERSNLLSVTGMSAQALFSLAIFDDRLKVNSGQYLYLAEWEGPRRESLSEALRAVLVPGGPMEFDEILQQVEKRMKRPCERRALINCLQAVDAEVESGTSRWMRNVESLGEDDGEVEQHGDELELLVEAESAERLAR
ncbi:RNA polymerase sigma factor (sigma-70 family) [Bradyrhizobium huanghuaihaiense]